MPCGIIALAKRVLVMVIEAEGLPIGRFLSVHTAPLVSYEANLEEDKEMVGQFHDKARTDAEIVVIAGGRSAKCRFFKSFPQKSVASLNYSPKKV